jgi:hypothetical protein
MRLFNRSQRKESDLARAMRDLAEAFVKTGANSGVRLDHSVESVRRLDGVIEALAATDRSRSMDDAMTRAAAAYFGDALVRAERAEWTLTPGEETPLLIVLPHRVPVVNVVAVVRRRARDGPADGISALLDLCLSGRRPDPGSATGRGRMGPRGDEPARPDPG